MKTLSKSAARLTRPVDPARCAALCIALLLVRLTLAPSAGATPPALHLNTVTALAFSPDQKIVAASESSGRLTVRNFRDGAIVWSAYHCRLSELVFSGDSSLIASSGESRTGEPTIKLWVAATGAVVLTVTNSFARPRQLLISPDKSVLLAAFDGGGVACWEVGNGRVRWFRPNVAATEFLTVTPDGTLLQGMSSRQSVTLLSVRDGLPIRELLPDR